MRRMERIVIEMDPAGGWTVRVPGTGPNRLRASSRHVAERLAREQLTHVRAREIVVRDAYHRVLPRERAGSSR